MIQRYAASRLASTSAATTKERPCVASEPSDAKAPAAAPPCLTDFAMIGDLISAMGTPQFEPVLFDAISRFAHIDHYGIVAVAANATPQFVAGHGRIPAKLFAEISRCYEAELFRQDPCVSKIMARKGDAEPMFFDYGDGAAYPPFYRRKLLEPAAISDKHSFAFWRDRTGYLVNFYRINGDKFSQGEKERLNSLNLVLAAPIARHLSLLPRIRQGSSDFLERVLNASASFKTTTARERAVCLGILRGHTSESISLHLNIARNTVLTYRKRLYEKLSICSQHELFMLFIESAQKFDRPSNDPAEFAIAGGCFDEWTDGFA